MTSDISDLRDSRANIVWSPQEGPQAALVHCPVEEIFFGGSRGGGKTDAAIGFCAIKSLKYGRQHKAIFFRRELPQLDAVIARSKEIYEPLGATYNESKKTWTFKNGATVRFRHLDRDSDAGKYQGQNNQTLCFEELTQFPSPKPVLKLKATLRSTAGVPCQMLATGNPGGPGHSWVKKRYIDPNPLGWRPIRILNEKTGRYRERVYIPSRLVDNRLLVEADPEYEDRIVDSANGDDQLLKAWLDGVWDIVEGAYFSEWDSRKHVIPTCSLPDHWLRFRCGDWGSAKPFSFHWAAVASEGYELPNGRWIPKGAVVFFEEYYGIKYDSNGEFQPNVGLKLFAEAVGRNLADIEKNMPKIAYGVLDPAAFATDGGPSIAERIWRGSSQKVMFRPADNKRTPGRGAMGGWDQLRSRLAGEDFGDGLKRPMVYWMDKCVHAIRTIPMLQHDENNIEDVDTDGEDHAADGIRYGLMSRPYISRAPNPKRPIAGIEQATLGELFKQREQDVDEASLYGRRI